MKLYEKYAGEIPQDVTQIIAALNDPIRRAILVLLTKYNELSFSDIKKYLGLTKLTLNYHLKNLYSAGLTDHYFRHELGNQKYSFYSITSLGSRVLSNLIKALIPPVPFRKIEKQASTEGYEVTPSDSGYTCPASYWTNGNKNIVQNIAPCSKTRKSTESNVPTDLVIYEEAE